MKTKRKSECINTLLPYLDEILPFASCELFYNKDYELMIAVMLSAQTTDASVNKVTPILFKKYPTIEAIANADIKDVEDIIHSIGLYKNKATNLVLACQKVLRDYGGALPSDKDALQTLPGIGNKSAGVIRAEAFHIPDLPVDTHILRISKRLGLVKDSNGPLETELTLKKLIAEDRWIKTHHQLIHFGRYHCLARNPHCEGCKMKAFCKNFHN